MARIPSRTVAGMVALLLLAACSDSPVAPGAPVPSAGLAQLHCTAHVPSGTVTCGDPPSSGALRTTRILGGQDKYVRLTSSGTRYDSGTEIFESTLTVQNLLRNSIGTDGVGTPGVMVFFAEGPSQTGGTGGVTLANPDGHGVFTNVNQAYYLYNEVLAPYQISQGKLWQFSVPATVTSFTFRVYVAAPQADVSLSLLGSVWTGLTGSAWELAANWRNGMVPDSTSTVAVPPDSSITSGNRPVLGADADVLHLRVGPGATLGLAGHTMHVRGNADAVGTISGGTVALSGSAALLRGNLPTLRITGSTTLQGAVRVTGAATVADGSLTVKDRPLSIQIP